ncbi:MAG TPA: hypothetical protein VMC84_03030 [Methanocella sp.]|uniref:hypothetical protein n=1 Tax=Methanocella sp. TaxID=2052833 RepID=UPI002BC17140|nr:hypothetical protein [Methanocella sp.]HTY90127.1 hypothetical protein [Methanocella sp.]
MVFESMTKKRWLSLILIVIVVTLFRTMIQPLIPESGPSPFPPSGFVRAGLMPLAFVVYGVIMLGLLALVFILIQDGLPGSKLVKGLTFSLAFGALWFVYLLEPLPHGTWQLPQALYYPVVDGVTLALIGLLLGLFVATDSKDRFTFPVNSGTLAALAIPAIFVAGRLVSYDVFHIYSTFDARTFDTLLWCTALGLWVAAMYLLLRPGLKANTPLAKAAFFGVVVFGLNIFLNDLFMPIPFAMPLSGLGIFSYEDMAVRTAMDVISVIVGVYAYEKLNTLEHA